MSSNTNDPAKEKCRTKREDNETETAATQSVGNTVRSCAHAPNPTLRPANLQLRKTETHEAREVAMASAVSPPKNAALRLQSNNACFANSIRKKYLDAPRARMKLTFTE
jgi:hypothetical protein